MFRWWCTKGRKRCLSETQSGMIVNRLQSKFAAMGRKISIFESHVGISVFESHVRTCIDWTSFDFRFEDFLSNLLLICCVPDRHSKWVSLPEQMGQTPGPNFGCYRRPFLGRVVDLILLLSTGFDSEYEDLSLCPPFTPRSMNDPKIEQSTALVVTMFSRNPSKVHLRQYHKSGSTFSLSEPVAATATDSGTPCVCLRLSDPPKLCQIAAPRARSLILQSKPSIVF